MKRGERMETCFGRSLGWWRWSRLLGDVSEWFDEEEERFGWIVGWVNLNLRSRTYGMLRNDGRSFVSALLRVGEDVF